MLTHTHSSLFEGQQQQSSVALQRARLRGSQLAGRRAQQQAVLATQLAALGEGGGTRHEE